ncbi:LamG-like jellyroll fold domain-containing protein [Flagellimonas meridianipacifica]|uniref:Concanavalin A-like lectin/glucanase superfamily protein n=1 Tax=Flagellimonas meridianipacifica TaxID=1080225 RepID=A0A2T0MCV6_9FLAO|nr:LamG-like jellyroll fold domain-containing protein [Allomuricauda pacifica]PRX55314.1 concanavalin A-like lectin/glucanase superfamily protein [Allomuricauda pacifica]
MFKKTTTALACLMALFYGMAQENTLKESLIFYAPFNESTTAQVAVGDAEIYSASSRKELQNAIKGLEGSNVIFVKDIGLSGGALDFKKKGKPVVFFDAFRNMGYSKESWSGAISFWLQLDPAKDLEPGFCDPIQITDVNYNDASIWVDFTKENPRDFRLGVIGDLELWNPNKIGPDNNPALEKRLVRMKNPPFKRGEWTHIVINFSNLGADSSEYQLYVNGELQGTKKDIGDLFTWEEEKAKIFLGLNYIGLMDELSVFNQPLSAETINMVYKVKSLGLLIEP